MFDNIEAKPPNYVGDDRPVRPPRPVWVDLPALFETADAGAHVPAGWDTRHQVPGQLQYWGRAVDGSWIALVHYRLARADGADVSSGGMTLTHWLPTHLVRPRDDQR